MCGLVSGGVETGAETLLEGDVSVNGRRVGEDVLDGSGHVLGQSPHDVCKLGQVGSNLLQGENLFRLDELDVRFLVPERAKLDAHRGDGVRGVVDVRHDGEGGGYLKD